MNEVLARWNTIESEEAATEILPCCGSLVWAERIAARRPFAGMKELLESAKEIWLALRVADWIEAFESHPRIGESRPSAGTSAQSREWSSEEQRKVAEGDAAVKTALAEGNRKYEERFRRIFIVCATGKSPGEILEILRRRLQNDEATELRLVAAEQMEIMQIRLRKWLGV